MSDLRRATERIEREEFARGNIGPGEQVAEPRPAATIVVACQTPGDPFRVLLLRRPETSRFAAGAYVFPGGVIDPADRAVGAADLLPPALRETEPAAAVAALRELFEETGFLASDRPVDAARAADTRSDLLAGRIDFARAAERLGASFQGLQGAYMSRWVTPARFSRRYDTRFFLARIGAGEPPAPELTAELAGYAWKTPAEAVRQFAAGELPMLFPTRKTLEMMSEEPDLEHLLRRCGGAVPRPIEPRLLIRGESIRPVLPGDPGYDDAV